MPMIIARSKKIRRFLFSLLDVKNLGRSRKRTRWEEIKRHFGIVKISDQLKK